MSLSAEPTVCAICQSPLQAGEDVAECPGCHARYHAECWEENRGCAVYGCAEVPPTEARETLEIPVSYWGQEEKPCPACGQTILAAAVRCRHCGATFSSARPESAAEFRSRTNRQDRSAGFRTKTVWLFVFCVLPCTAPVAGIIGVIWYAKNRRDIRDLPGIFVSLCLLGLALALVQTIMAVGFTVLYATTEWASRLLSSG